MMTIWPSTLCIKPRFLAVILVVSLLLNAFSLPLVAGALTGSRLPALLMVRSQINDLLGQLPAERQQALRAMIKQKFIPELRQQLGTLSSLRLKLADVIAQPDLSAADLKQAFTAIRTHTTSVQGDFQDQIAQVILSLSPQERAQLANGVRKVVREHLDAIAE